jgi:hypothetical protein
MCESLPSQQLAASAPGAYGTIFETLHHLIESDGHYAHRVAPALWPADLHRDANDAWEASLGGASQFEWVRTGGPESERLERRRAAFLDGDHAGAFAVLHARATTVAHIWRTYADGDPDVTARCTFNLGPGRQAESSAVAQILQAQRHAHEHQEQVCAVLTSIGVPAPDLSGLAWAESIGDVRSVE